MLTVSANQPENQPDAPSAQNQGASRKLYRINHSLIWVIVVMVNFGLYTK